MQQQSNPAAVAGAQANSVDIWLTSTATVTGSLLKEYERLLAPEEIERKSRFVVSGARDQYLVARALLRTTLSKYSPILPEQWEFAANDYGRPYIARPILWPRLHFNISHTDGLVACAVSACAEIGVDVENLSRALDCYDLAPKVFAAPEVAALFPTSGPQLKSRFFYYWTLKEAYVKARGLGLSIPLDAFWFDAETAEPSVHFSERCPDASKRWRFFSYNPTDEHKLALAVALPQEMALTVNLHWVTPLRSENISSSITWIPSR